MPNRKKWKAYSDIVKQFHSDMTPCEKLELYARMDSVYDGNLPDHLQEMNYMEAALQCGDTATFKKNVVKLKWLIDTLGFPTWERVCSYGSYDAWVIAQHAPMQYQFALPDRNATGCYRCC